MTPAQHASAAEYYDRYWAARESGPDQAILPSLARLLARTVNPDDSCIDVGCGQGKGAGTWLNQNAASYLGVDVSERAVAAARASGLTVKRIDDASSLPAADGTFDLAVCIEVLEHLLNPQETAKEILRVLRPGGRLVATVPNVAYWRRRADLAFLGRWKPLGDPESAYRPWRDPHIRFFGRANLERMLSESGYVPVTTGGHGGPWLADVPGLRRLGRRPQAGPVYQHLVRMAPSVFAHHVHAIATRPHSP
jgi:methionine biosynthesis protein MetW